MCTQLMTYAHTTTKADRNARTSSLIEPPGREERRGTMVRRPAPREEPGSVIPTVIIGIFTIMTTPPHRRTKTSNLTL